MGLAPLVACFDSSARSQRRDLCHALVVGLLETIRCHRSSIDPPKRALAVIVLMASRGIYWHAHYSAAVFRFAIVVAFLFVSQVPRTRRFSTRQLRSDIVRCGSLTAALTREIGVLLSSDSHKTTLFKIILRVVGNAGLGPRRVDETRLYMHRGAPWLDEQKRAVVLDAEVGHL